MNLKPVIRGLVTYLPGWGLLRKRVGRGTESARYCYSAWMRHMVMASQAGLNAHPEIVAELGPGRSLGMGLAALAAGCRQYCAFDVVRHANLDLNAELFE